jgi:hypothetical protein
VSKDWTGNSKATFTTLGASNHVEHDRETHDYYATEPKALELLLDVETFNHDVWECACGEGHLSEVLIKRGYNVLSTDLIERGYGRGGVDFLAVNERWNGDILTNPPYRYALDFVKKRLSIVPEGNRVIMFLKILFLEGKERGEFFKSNPPKVVYVSRSRLRCRINGRFTPGMSSATAYAWFIWEKGFKGEPVIRWFN